MTSIRPRSKAVKNQRMSARKKVLQMQRIVKSASVETFWERAPSLVKKGEDFSEGKREKLGNGKRKTIAGGETARRGTTYSRASNPL